MPWIRTEEGDQHSVINVMSINPRAMEAVSNLNRAVTFGASALTRV